MYKPNERDKEIFRQRIIKGAQLFDKYLLHKEFPLNFISNLRLSA